MTSPQTTRLRNAIVKIINKVGVQVTWSKLSAGAASSTGYPGNSPIYTSKSITVSLQPIDIIPKELNVGFIADDERIILCKYTDVVTQMDRIIWNGQTFMVMAVQDVTAFGDQTNPGAGDILVYRVKIKRSPTGQ